jgi:hypothetical protein
MAHHTSKSGSRASLEHFSKLTPSALSSDYVSTWKGDCPLLTADGSGVICATRALHAAVIPAKAGIHSASLREWADCGLDSRFRGNDGGFVGHAAPNDTNTLLTF